MNVKSSYCRMPPKADYWKYFTVQGLLALCQIEGCPKPTVVALAKRFCSVLCCLIFNWVLHLGTVRLQLLRPQLRGCSVRQASLWTPNGISCVQLLLISCCSSERLTFWVCASYPGSRDFSLYIYLSSHVYK